jgi:hypothetical protein
VQEWNGSNEADFVSDAFLLIIKQVPVSWSLSAINVEARGIREYYMWRREKKTKAKARRRSARRSHLNVHQYVHQEKLGGLSCAKIVLLDIFLEKEPQHSQRVYAIIDDQSNASMISPELANKLGARGSQ